MKIAANHLHDQYLKYLEACQAEGKKPLNFHAWQKMPSGEFRGYP